MKNCYSQVWNQDSFFGIPKYEHKKITPFKNENLKKIQHQNNTGKKKKKTSVYFVLKKGK